MLMVILGAGASFDSTPRHTPGMGITANGMSFEPRPPLANDLFATRFRETWKKFPDIEPLVPRLHTSVEATLQKFLEEAEFDPERHKQLMAIRHYVPRIVGKCEDRWFSQHRVTNHAGLLDGIRSWCVRHDERACFVTFNYDTFIEKAFWNSPLRMGIRELDDYIENDRYKVIKLHGSVNWFHEVESPLIGDLDLLSDEDIMGMLISRAEGVKTKKEICVEEWTTVCRPADSERVVIPAIAIPVQDKSGPGFECPDKHVEVLKACIPSVTKLMLIGWAGKEKAFLGMLKKLSKDADTVVVGASQENAEEIAGDLNEQGIPCSFKPSHARGFSKFVEEGEADAFLFR